MKNNIFINKYVMACAISIVIALVGYISMSTLPVEQYPDIAPPTVNVSTSYTGADENTVMKSVIQPLDQRLFQAGYRPRHGDGKCAEPRNARPGPIAC